MTPRFHPIGRDLLELRIPFSGIYVSVFLVNRQERAIIDSGFNARDVDAILVPALAELGLAPADIGWLLCTHTHGDHIGGHARLHALGVQKCAVWTASQDKMRDPLKYNRLIRAAFPEHSAPPAPVLDGVEPDRLLQDGDCVCGLRMLPTPGHDTDCVSWLDPATGTLLTGDSLQGNGTATQGCALYMDLPAYEASLRRLLREPISRIVMGHPFFPWCQEASETEPAGAHPPTAIADCLRLIEAYDTFLAAQPADDLARLATALIRHMGGNVPDKLFLAMFTAREHLRRLGR